MFFKKLLYALKHINFKQVSMKWENCHLCGWKIQIKTRDDEMGIRCTRCFATPVAQVMGKTFKKHIKPNQNIYELSSRGAFVRYLSKQNINLTLSEYFDGVENGTTHEGIICQNVEKLTFASNSFDICTSLEVFEHVEDDMQGFKEIYRVLNKNGIFIFTVPINLDAKTVERTQLINGKREKTLPAEYHSDSIRGTSKVFCFRNYGYDIIDRLSATGFKNCKIIKPSKNKLFGYERPIIFATKN